MPTPDELIDAALNGHDPRKYDKLKDLLGIPQEEEEVEQNPSQPSS